MRHRMLITALAASATLALAACAPATQADTAAPTTLNVVASTTVYADLARQIGGDAVTTTAIITRTSQDPHSYEATPQDKLSVSKADIVIENGGGYDTFMDVLTRSTPLPADRLISAVDFAGDHGHSPEAPADHAGHDHGEFNEHVWYDLPTMQSLVDGITGSLTAADPAHGAQFKANAEKLHGELGALESRLAALRPKAEGRGFAMTEPAPYHLLEGAGMSDATPAGFGEAIEGGLEVPPLVMRQMTTALENGAVKLLAINTQTSSDQTTAVTRDAERAGVPVLEFTETLPGGQDYQDWMGANIDALAAALR